MAQLRQDFKLFQKENTVILVVGPDKKEAFTSYWEGTSLGPHAGRRPEQVVLKQYGQEFKVLKLGRLPAMVIIDQSGQVHYIHYGNSRLEGR